MRFLRCWKRTRMARRPRIRADRPALTSRVRVIRLTVGALSRLDSEQKLESYLNSTGVLRVLARVVEINPHRLSVGVHNHCRTIAQRHEAGVVEPLRQRLLVGWDDGVFAGAVVDVIPPTERRPALIRVDTLYLPAANKPRHESVGVTQEHTAFPKRQFVNRAHREPVRIVRIRYHFGR